MVYIDRNGRVLEKRPWDMARIMEIFTGLWLVVVQFFQTLIAPFCQENRGGNRRGTSGWGSGSGSGGGGGGGGGGGNGGLRPNRRIGRVTNSMDCNIPGGG
ncbi:glycine-rich selenoprotein-like [Haematobia irritans]|uniref:Putative glycine-rich selenoprotein n=1 Tax=Haematobia irritans TaxID=7368 RepID=A0A1L8EEW1_HAEIR